MRSRKLLLGLGWIVVATIVVLSLGPQFDPGGPEQASDKVFHAGAYALAALSFVAGRSPVIRVAAALVALGGLLEAAQLLRPDRSAEAADVVANVVGVAIGVGFGLIAAQLTGRADQAPSGR